MPPNAAAHGAAIRRWGEFHRDGKYYRFTRGTVLVVRGWPQMQAWRRTPKAKAWRMVRPHLRVDLADPICSDTTPKKSCLTFDRFDRRHDGALAHFADDAEEGPLLDADPAPSEEPAWKAEAALRAADARRQFVASFPDEIRKRLFRFEERQWHLAVLMARCVGAADLVDATPALAWMLASSWCFKKAPVQQPLRAARRLLKRRQADIAAWLDLPARRSTISVLRKVPPAACRMAILLPLSRLLSQEDTLPLLRHARRINGTTIALLREDCWRPLVSPRLLSELVERGGDTSAADGVSLLRDTIAMLDHLHLERRTPFANLAAIERIHDECVERMAEAEATSDEPLPSPPVTGTATIHPLQTAAALLAEGRLQRNCVGAYAPLVINGDCYVYRVEAPERATLAIEPSAGGWRVREIVAFANTPVSPDTLEAVHQWLSRGPSPGKPR